MPVSSNYRRQDTFYKESIELSLTSGLNAMPDISELQITAGLRQDVDCQAKTADLPLPQWSTCSRCCDSSYAQAFMIILTVLTLIVACISLWPCMASDSKSDLANELAKWEAQKDLNEFCENVSCL